MSDMALSKPQFSRVGEGHYRLALLREGIMLDVKRLRWESRGELHGLLVVAADHLKGAKTVDGNLSVGTFNLTSVSARTTRAKELAARAKSGDELDWAGLLEELCQRVIVAEEKGEPIKLLRDVQVPPDADHGQTLISGFPILQNHPSILFGDGGTGKSTLALFFAGELERHGVSTLYLDWELDQVDHRRQLERLFGPDMPDVKYKRCERPLAIESETIGQQIQECGIDFVVCDSVVGACDGPPESAEVVQRYFRALRQLRVGSLSIAHITKGENADRRPFGSTFWFNFVRAGRYAEQAESGPGDDSIHVGLYHRKFNLGRRSARQSGFRSVREDRTEIVPTNVADNDHLAAKLSLATALPRGPSQTQDAGRARRGTRCEG